MAFRSRRTRCCVSKALWPVVSLHYQFTLQDNRAEPKPVKGEERGGTKELPTHSPKRVFAHPIPSFLSLFIPPMWLSWLSSLWLISLVLLFLFVSSFCCHGSDHVRPPPSSAGWTSGPDRHPQRVVLHRHGRQPAYHGLRLLGQQFQVLLCRGWSVSQARNGDRYSRQCDLIGSTSDQKISSSGQIHDIVQN